MTYRSYNSGYINFDGMKTNIRNTRANKALVPTAGAALSAMLSVTLARPPISERHPAPAVGTA